LRCFFYFTLIVIQFLPVAAVFAQDNLRVKVTLSSAEERTTPPKSILTSVFTILNSGTDVDTYTFERIVPDGWQVISSLNPLTLLPQESKKIPLSISIPLNALTSHPYKIKLTASSGKDSNIKDSAEVTVTIFPHARVKVVGPPSGVVAYPGKSVRYAFTVVNLGNGGDRFKIAASSAHGEKVDLSHEVIDLQLGEQKEVTATVYIPLDVSSGTRHVLTFRAHSILLEEGIFDEVIVYTAIEKGKVKKEGMYKTLPSQMTFYLSGLGTGERLAPQTRFSTGGELNDRYWMDFMYQGPYFKDRENYRGFSEDRITLDVGSEAWDVSLGDTLVNLSELTALSLSEEGARFRIKKGSTKCMVFHLEKKQPSFKEKFFGGTVKQNLWEHTELGINFFQSDEDKTDPSATRLAEEKKILSFSTLHRSKDLFIEGEFAGSHFDDGSGEKEDSAWWVNTAVKKGKFYVDTEYFRLGSDYAGRRKDNDGYRASMGYRLFKPLWAWIHKYKYNNNVEEDPATATDYTDRIELGSSWNSKDLPFISFSYGINDARSEQGVLLSDSREETATLRCDETWGAFSLSFDSKWSEKKDDIKSVDTETADYITRIYGRRQKIRGWIGYGYNVEEDNIGNTESVLTRKEFGGIYQLSTKLSFSFSFTREESQGEDESDIVVFDTYYQPWDDAYFSLEGEYRNDNNEVIQEWQFWLMFRTNFDMPLPFFKTRGRVDGLVFIDENTNGMFDKGERGEAGIKLLIEGEESVSDKKGRFIFPSVVPGDYGLRIDIASMPVGLAPHIDLPCDITVTRGKTEDIAIPLVRVCKVVQG